MSARLLPLIGLISLLAFVDSAAARPRRMMRSFQPAPAVSLPTPAREKLQQVIYPVADLIVPIPSRENLDVEPLPRAIQTSSVAGEECEVPPLPRATATTFRHPPKYEAPSMPREARNAKCAFEECALSPLLMKQKQWKRPPGATLETELMELVTSTVTPGTWKAAGGVGTVQYFPLSMSLVVNQTEAVQEEVRNLLAALRRLQDVEAVVEMRIVTVAPAVFERACKQMNITRITEEDNAAVAEKNVIGPKGKRWTASLGECQVRELLNLVQADQSTNVTQAPKVTMFSSQITSLEISHDQWYLTGFQRGVDRDSKSFVTPSQTRFTTGLRIGLQPVVSADRRSTRVQMKGYWCQPAGPVERQTINLIAPVQNDDGKEEKVPFSLTLQKPTYSQVRLNQDINLADGATALVSCGVVPVEVDRNDLSAYWHCLWTGERLTTSADRHVFFLVTSRIIVNEEQEVPTSVTMPRP